MSVKLVIGTRAALERLIGGDSEIEVEIRNGIVQDFAKRYLKSIADTPAIKESAKKLAEKLSQTMEQQAKSIIGRVAFDFKGQPYFLDLNPTMREAITKSVESSINCGVAKMVKEQIEAMVTDGRIDAMIEKHTKEYGALAIRNELKRRLEAAVNELGNGK